jgi:plasmid stabilization system protein ParE
MNCSPLWTLMQIVWSPQSLRDLLALRDYIAKDSEQYADLTIARIFSTVERLLSECL